MFGTSYEMLLRYVAKDGFIRYYGHKIPMTRFLKDIEGFAAGLNTLNLQKGDVVTVYLPSCPQALVAFYACSKLGLVANIVHPLVPLNLLSENLQKVHSKALLFYDALVKDEHPLQSLGQILVRCSIADYVSVRKPLFKLYASAVGKRVFCRTYRRLAKTVGTTAVAGQSEDLLCYMHSGGTSGTPKTVQLTNNSFNQTAWGIKQMYHPQIDSSCVNLVTLPVFHAYGLCAGVHAPLIIGFSLSVVPKFNPKTVQKCLQRDKITCWSVVPAMLKKLLAAGRLDNRRALKNLDVIWCGGDVLDESLVETVDAILRKYNGKARLMRGYGLTEVCGVCIVNNYDHYRKNSCGKPMPNCRAEIWDDKGDFLPAGQTGEIVIATEGRMQGYLEGENCVEQRRGEYWVKTGDVGYMDSDGFVYVVDRKKRMLKIAAVNVFPAQIEQCVKQLPFVDEACAVGYLADGKQFVKVFVTLSVPTPAQEVSREVTEICRRNLIGYSVPKFVEVLDKMPRTAIGKVDYKSLENK